jgi:hypothetical protein
MNTRVVALTATVLLLGATPSPMPTVPPGIGTLVQNILQSVTGNAAAPYGLDPNHVRGTVMYFKRFDLQVRMPLNVYKDIHLHQGTIIDPRGASLAPGQVIDVRGHANGDGSLDADAITIVHD